MKMMDIRKLRPN